jgi:hypothetical protein
MAIHSGTSGSVVYQTTNGTAGTLVGEIKNWTLTVEAEELDTSAFGQSWRGFDAGIKQWSGSFEGNKDNDDGQQTALWTNLLAGTKAEVTFFLSGTAGYYGTVVILGEEVAQAFDAFGETSYNFRGDGTLAKK